MATSQDFVNWICRDSLSPEFLKYLFIAEGGDLLRFSSGAVHQTIYFPEAKAFYICHPPITEQRRIVSVLDHALEILAASIAHTFASLKNAGEIFDAYCDTVFTHTRADWKTESLGYIGEFRNGLNFTKGSRGERIKIVGVRNFQNRFSAPMDDLDTVTIDGKLSDTDALAKGDILTVRSNGNIDLIGRCMLVDEVSEPTAHSGFTIRIRLTGKNVLPRFLCYFLKARSSRQKLVAGGSGTNIKSLNQGTLAGIAVPVPSLEEQRRIVATLDVLADETRQLATVYEKKVATLSALKESLLHHAFTGQL